SNLLAGDVEVRDPDVTIDGFTFVFDGTPGTGGTRQSGGIRSQAPGLVVNNNAIEVGNGNASLTLPALGVQTLTGSDQSGLMITNKTFQAETPAPAQPIHLNPGTGSAILVSGNTITGSNLSIGIFVDTISNVTVRQNTISRTGTPTVVSTLIAVGPVNGSSDQTNVTIDQNNLTGGF